MSSPKAVEVQTQHGDIAYEVVTCANCGEDVLPEDALMVGLEFESVRCDGLPICRTTHQQPTETRVICSFCSESVFGYPPQKTGDVRQWLQTVADDESPVGVGLWLGIVIGVGLLVALAVVAVGGPLLFGL